MRGSMNKRVYNIRNEQSYKRLMNLTTYFGPSLLIWSQSFRMSCVILVEVQPTGINSRPGKRLQRSFLMTPISMISTSHCFGVQSTILFKLVCIYDSPMFLFSSNIFTGYSLVSKTNLCPFGCDSVYDICTHPADLIWLQKRRVLYT